MAEHEIKFILNNQHTTKLISWITKRCIPDPLFHQGIVSSVYYDTPDWKFLNEKLNSDFLKTKMRLRWYQKIPDRGYYQKVFFETKNKTGSSRKKIRSELPMHNAIAQAIYLNDSFFMQLPLQLITMGHNVPANLLPAFQISYTRLRFIDQLSNARIAIDSDIHVPRTNPMMIGKASHSLPLTTAVFEYKSDKTVIPDWLHPITALGCRKSSFSKYSTCFHHLTGGDT